jgi:hypothetical protein
VAFQLALEISLRTPEAVYRNPEKVATAWQIQRENRDRFVRLFGSDLVVVSGDEAQQRLDEYWASCGDEMSGGETAGDAHRDARVPSMELPPEVVNAESVALIYDEVDGLGFYAEFGVVAEAFAEPGLLRRRRHRGMVLSYLHDDSVEPMVLRRLADRDPDKASVVFGRLLKKPRFKWRADGEQLLRACKPGYFDTPVRPRVSPVSERLADYARRR